MQPTDSPEDIERVLLAGASGKTGRRVLGRFAAADVTVQALTRSAEKRAPLERAGADDVVVGDLRDPADARRAVDGVDAVLTCVGSTPRQVYLADDHVDGTGNVNLVDAATVEGVEAFVMLSSLGVDGDRESWMARFFRTLIGPVIAAKTRAERAIRASGLRYTIFRPGLLLSYGPGACRVAEAGTGLWGAVTRGEVARLLAAAPFTPAAADRTYEVTANPLQRGRGISVDWQRP